MNPRSWAERRQIVPSPLSPSQTGVNALMVGEGQGEGYNTHCFYFGSQNMQPAVVQSARESNFTLGALSQPLSLSLPHKGGGNHVGSAFAPRAMYQRVDSQRCVRAAP